MEKEKMRICFAGPSGLGNSTLAHVIAKRLKLPHPSTSAGDLFTYDDKVFLKENFDYEGKGHKSVINLSSTSPDFGIYFQQLLLNRRSEQIKSYDRVVLDRSPIDNVTYMLTQAAHNMDEKRVLEFITEAQSVYLELDYLILIIYSHDIPLIEDNKSRIPNRYFQIYISDVFMGTFNRYFSHIIGPRVITIDFWDLQERINTVLSFINNPQLKMEI